jgi:hypothetical protein
MQMASRFFASLCVMLVSVTGFGFGTRDTTRLRSIKPALDFDQRFSFIRKQPVNIWGQRIGILVNERFKVGIGGYFTNQRFDDNADYVRRKLYFGTVYFEPFLVRKKYWELSIVTEAGFGLSNVKVYESSSNRLDTAEVKDFFPAGAGLSLSLKLPAFFGWRPFRWFGINGLVGYRYDIDENALHTPYDGMFWSISGAIFLDRVSDDIHYWRQRKKDRQNPPSPH